MTRRLARLAGAALVGGLTLGFLPGVAQAVPPDPPPVQPTATFRQNIPANYDPFTDDNGDTFENEIECIAAVGITQGGPGGLPPNNYGPGINVARDQMASFIARQIDAANRLDAPGAPTLPALPAFNGQNRFTDVPANNPHIANINRLAQAGVVNGTTPTTYSPSIIVTRGQIASFINRAQAFLQGQNPANSGVSTGFVSNQNFFTDDDTSVHQANINAVASRGIYVGDGVDRAQPNNGLPRNQMAGLLCRHLADNAEAGLITNSPAPIQVQLASTTAAPGGNVTGTITGDNIASATVTGPCVSGTQNLTDTNAGTPGFQVSVPITPNATAGSCTLQFRVTRTAQGGGDVVTVLQTITIAGQGAGSTNARPELQSAAIVSTTAPSQVTPTNPVGTTVRYVFDEQVGSVPGGPGAFFVYRFNDPNNPVPGDASATVDPSNPNAVLVRFSTIIATTGTGAASTGDISAATVDFGAVLDTQGFQNPEGDAALGSGQQGSAALTSGRTQAPDLTSIAFRTGNVATNTTVDFVFDVNAFTQDPAGAGFELVRTDASQPNIVCTAPTNSQNNTTNPGGGTAAGGNGTTTITTQCQNIGGGTTPLSTASIARGIVQTNSVGTTPAAGVATFTGIGGIACGGTNAQGTVNRCNPQESSDTPDGGTTGPDLVSVTFTPGATPTSTDTVIYTFDQNVNAPVAGNETGFFVYFNDGTELAGAALQNPGGPQRNASNQAQVAVVFPAGTLATGGGATGGNVDPGTVTGQGGVVTNREDEAGATNVTQPSQTTQPAGRTAAPDLTAVALTQGGTFGNQFVATYVFDQRVNNGTAPAAPVAGNLFLHLADGSRLQCTAAGFTNPTATTGDAANSVTCTAFNVITGPATLGGASSAQIGAAVLGTVNDAAVSDASGRQNPEGAEPTAGGTGTRQ